jgi:hypothetical protein
MKKELFPFFQKANVAQGSSPSDDYLKLILASWRTDKLSLTAKVRTISYSRDFHVFFVYIDSLLFSQFPL